MPSLRLLLTPINLISPTKKQSRAGHTNVVNEIAALRGEQNFAIASVQNQRRGLAMRKVGEHIERQQ